MWVLIWQLLVDGPSVVKMIYWCVFSSFYKSTLGNFWIDASMCVIRGIQAKNPRMFDYDNWYPTPRWLRWVLPREFLKSRQNFKIILVITNRKIDWDGRIWGRPTRLPLNYPVNRVGVQAFLVGLFLVSGFRLLNCHYTTHAIANCCSAL